MKRKLFIALWLTALMLSAPLAGTLRAAKYPPGQHWREISRGRFTVIFPAVRFIEAEAALFAAEKLHERMADFWRTPFLGRTRIVLDDSTDQANGFATFYPFNLVGVNLAEPPPDSELASGRTWLDLVLAHELTHVFTLNAGSPPFRTLRLMFGSQPALYPAVQMPPWVIEGLAVYGESALTNDGRLNHPPYRLMLAAARRDGLFPGWKSLAGMPVAWPGPSAKYLFGAGFMQFLAARYGADTLRQYLERSTSRLVSFSSGRDFKKTFKEPLGKLWDEYQSAAPAAQVIAEPGPAPEPLTKNGFLQQYPCPLGDDRLLYYRRDYQSRGEVAVLDLKTGRDRSLFEMDAVNGLSVVENGKKILLSAVDHFHAFSEFSDLYEYDLEKEKLKRLSRGQRLSQPVNKENSNEIYCVQRHDNRYYLALFDARKSAVRIVSRPFTGMAQLSVSPDRSMVAAAVKPEGGPWGIGLFSENGEVQALISLPNSDLSQPRWLNDRQLFFILAGRETTRLASLRLDGGGNACADPRLEGLRQFDISRDGREIFFTCDGGRGQELARIALADLPFIPMEITVSSGIPEISFPTSAAFSRPYRPWRDLLPRWWSPALRSAGDEIQVGAMTGGQDALGIHGYALEGYYGFSSRRGNALFHYVYDGLFPTLSLSISDSIEYFRNHDTSIRSREMKLASLWPLRLRKSSQLFAYADLHLERRAVLDDWGAYEIQGSTNGIRLGIDFNSSREYYDSISPADGGRATVQSAFHPAGLGNAWASRSIQADLRRYLSLFRPGVLAWRLALARSWNTGHNAYDMGGLETRSRLGNDQPFRLLRGYGLGSFSGDRGWQFNLEYRLPLLKIEKALLPAVSIDRIWLNAFFDSGRLSGSYYTYPTAYSVGAETVLRLAFGGAVAFDLSFGVAHGFGPDRQWWFYLRTGRSF